MDFIVNFLEYCFSKKKTLIYTTFNQQDYYKVIDRLKANQVMYRVASISNVSTSPSGAYSDLGDEYKIYVKLDDKGKALRAIHQ
ncbi:hypothetical protein [Salinibacillus kushneri]|uniref:hypothetical protein n=1 Tax=Salinibacillus kushneri TaxID=237682 RepID=UPI000B87EF35|nr:hypothetical protein [Salinibacillus kushneri]